MLDNLHNVNKLLFKSYEINLYDIVRANGTWNYTISITTPIETFRNQHNKAYKEGDCSTEDDAIEYARQYAIHYRKLFEHL